MRHVSNPPNPWQLYTVDWLGEPPEVATTIWEQEARSILAENDSPDLGFRFSLNPYRGCQHACAYCYARPSHQHLDFGAGTDFERQIVVKTNAAALLRETFLRPRWTGELIAFSGNTDCYQPLEATYGLTRACLEVCAEFQNPVSIITKGALIRRDIDVLQRLPEPVVWMSVAWADDTMSHALEPGCTIPSQRFKTLRLLAQAGITCGVAVAPIIGGLNDDQVPTVLEHAREAGATRAFAIPLRLPGEVAPVFEERLRAAFPLRADKVLNAVRELRGGQLNDGRFGARMRGQGPRWAATRALFDAHCRRLGLHTGEQIDPPRTFRRPGEQLRLI